MKKTLDKSLWERYLKGYVITDIATRLNRTVALLLKPDWPEKKISKLNDDQIPCRVFLFFIDDVNKNAMVDWESGFESPILGASEIPVPQYLILSNALHGPVYPMGGGKADWEIEIIEENNFPLSKKIKCIDGYAWAVGENRQIYKRIELEKWEKIDKGFDKAKGIFKVGFKDIDGFSDNDIYAVGGKGDVWHYNGSKWAKCQFPSDEQLNTICCAKDGFVYIASRNSIWKGKENEWSKLCDIDVPLSLNDCCWFKDKLWITHDYGILIWDGEKVETEVAYKDMILPLKGYLDCTDDFLFVANLHAVWSFDGEEWTEVVRPYDIYEEIENNKK